MAPTKHFSLILDSSLAKLQKGNSHNHASHDFKIRFDPPINLGQEKNYKIALNKLISMSYSWYNVSQKYNNNTYKWKKTGEKDWKTETIPDGMYDYKDLNETIQRQTGKVDPSKKDSEKIFELYFHHSTFRAVILIQKGYELDLTEGDFADLLGFEKKILTAANNTSDRLPNITRGIDWVFIHCDCISREVNNVGGDVLFAFSTSKLEASYPFSFEPIHLEWHPVNRKWINEVNIRITDGRNNILYLNDIDVALSVIVEEEF